MAEYGSGGGDHGPVFVDVYGTGRRLGLKGHRRGLERPDNRPRGPHGFEGPHPDGPFWKRGLKGLLPLWTVFWGGFFFGHGVLLVFTIILSVLAVIFGMTVDPARTGASLIATGAVSAVIGVMVFLFVAWSVVAVWRCAPNVDDQKWSWAARFVVTLYAAAWGGAVWKFFA